MNTHMLVDNQARKNSGFALIETTIALAMGSFGILVLMSSMGTAGSSDSAATKRTVAVHHGHAIMQDIVADSSELSFDDFLLKWANPANQSIDITDLEDPFSIVQTEESVP